MADPLIDDKPVDYCGVFGVAGHPRAAALARLGLHALQHRGQESAGIMLLRNNRCELHKGMGLVSEVFDQLPREWRGDDHQMAIGHVRYSTAGSSSLVNASPLAVEFDKWYLGVAHNGTVSNGGVLRQRLKQTGAILAGTTDTEVILHVAARRHQMGDTPWESMRAALKNVEGAYSLLALCEDGLAAFRDPYGFRPLALGRLPVKDHPDAIVFASETTAFDLVGAQYVRDVEPGEFIHVNHKGEMESIHFDFARRRAHCIFELVYFSRPDSLVFGEHVHDVRKRMGARLALEAPVAADVVVPVPDGGVYAALGYAAQSGIPFDLSIVRNHYIGRTFIRPDDASRREGARLKLNPIRDAIRGKRVVLIDDSIVRGNTSKERVAMLREGGAKEVHMRVSCPPHISPCYYGIDFPNASELIANQMTLDEIARTIKVDSLHYLSLDGMLGCVQKNAPADFCHACFTKQYPVPPKLGISREEIRSCGA